MNRRNEAAYQGHGVMRSAKASRTNGARCARLRLATVEPRGALGTQPRRRGSYTINIQHNLHAVQIRGGIATVTTHVRRRKKGRT
jgi:hypothetical protein